MPEYIVKEQALEAITRNLELYGDEWIAAYNMVAAIPPADVAPVVHGKWEYDKDATDWGIGGYVCSECKNKNNNLPCTRIKWVKMFSGARYCPNCGARMYGGESDD